DFVHGKRHGPMRAQRIVCTREYDESGEEISDTQKQARVTIERVRRVLIYRLQVVQARAISREVNRRTLDFEEPSMNHLNIKALVGILKAFGAWDREDQEWLDVELDWYQRASQKRDRKEEYRRRVAKQEEVAATVEEPARSCA